MKVIKLGDACDILNGYAFKSDHYVDAGIRVIRIANVQKGYIEDNAPVFYPSDYSGVEKYILEENDLLMSLTGNVGRVALLDKEFLPAALNQRVACLRLKTDKISKGYLFHILNSDYFERQCILASNGVAQKNLSTEWLKEFEIPLYEKEKQEKITVILDKCRRIISYRSNEMTKYDELIKARFIELFGDTENNPFSWEKTKIGTVIQSCEAGWSGNGVQREKRDGEVAVLKVSAVTKGYFIPEECKVLDDQRSIKKYIFPEKGDLLFSRANTREMVGATAIVTQDYPEHILPDKLWKIRFTDDADVYYMKYVLSSNSIRSMFSAVSTGTSGSMYNVSMEKFKSITIPLPPRKLQNQFATFVKQIDKSKFISINIIPEGGFYNGDKFYIS